VTRTFRNTNGETHTVPDEVTVDDRGDYMETGSNVIMWIADGWSEVTEYRLPTKRGAVVYSPDDDIDFIIDLSENVWSHRGQGRFTPKDLLNRYPDLVTKFEGFDA